MCWKINKIEYETNINQCHKIADMDIIVYKMGNVWENDNTFYPAFIMDFIYEPNILNKETNLIIRESSFAYTGCLYILEGYHSYSEDCIYYNKNVYSRFAYGDKRYQYTFTDNLIEIFPNAYQIGKFIIPKGSEYYKKENGEIVSSNIIWTGENISINNSITECANKFKDLNICVGK